MFLFIFVSLRNLWPLEEHNSFQQQFFGFAGDVQAFHPDTWNAHISCLRVFGCIRVHSPFISVFTCIPARNANISNLEGEAYFIFQPSSLIKYYIIYTFPMSAPPRSSSPPPHSQGLCVIISACRANFAPFVQVTPTQELEQRNNKELLFHFCY